MWVHFLRHGAPDHATQRFPRLLAGLREGTPAADALRSAYGELSEIEPRFRLYVREFSP
jgi:hypothetical protein